jgi:serine/threonine protein kinase
MPPETFNDNPHYTESVDIFSLGVLVVEVATHSFPSVGMMGIGTTPEVERRAKDLKKMKADHPLKPLVLNCLRNNYKSRPDIDHVICGIIRIFTRQLSVKDKEIEDLRSAVETKDLELVLNNDIEEQVSDKDRDIAHLTSIVEMKDRQKAELECDISAKNREIESLRKTVELKDVELQQKEGVEVNCTNSIPHTVPPHLSDTS